ncbi:EF-hand domain-containing protein [Rubrivirga sp. IMCC45206]|uniref:EF-hand domain-containing protein n=1 Tax=Rubrivirga sp. IMCC45206 TaxID=3391614 RepID=UPI00399000D0
MLTDLQQKKLPNLFNLHDADDDGVLRKSDYNRVAQEIAQARGLEVGSTEEKELRSRFSTAWDSMSTMADTDQGRGVTLDGWYSYWETVLSTEGMYDDVVSPIGEFVFYLLGQDGSGVVSFDEYMTFCSIMGLDQEVAEDVFSRLDLDADGSLSRGEISVLLEQYFCSDDPAAPGNWFFGPYE